MEEFLNITEIITGICCLLSAVFLHYALVPDSKIRKHYQQGSALVKAGAILLGTASLIFAINERTDFVNEKIIFISIILPLETLLIVWAMIHLIFENRKLKRIMQWQTVFTIAQCLTGAVYYFIIKGRGTGLLHYILVTCYAIQLLLYTLIYYHAARLWMKSSPQRISYFRKRPLRVWIASFIMGILAIIAGCYPTTTFLIAFTVCYTLFFVYFCIEYHNYGITISNYLTYKVQNTLTIKTPVKRHEQNQKQIHEKLEEWKQEKRFLQPGITIQDISRSIGINRTYLSSYINETFQTNFNNWINDLRIEEAKQRLIAEPGISMSDLAEQVGFADQAHFSKQFKLKEGVPPSVWKKSNTRMQEVS